MPAPILGLHLRAGAADPQIGFVLTKAGVSASQLCVLVLSQKTEPPMSGSLPGWWPMRTIPGDLVYLDNIFFWSAAARPSQADAGSSAIFVDEFDACGFEALRRSTSKRRTPSLMRSALKLIDQ